MKCPYCGSNNTHSNRRNVREPKFVIFDDGEEVDCAKTPFNYGWILTNPFPIVIGGISCSMRKDVWLHENMERSRKYYITQYIYLCHDCSADWRMP